MFNAIEPDRQRNIDESWYRSINAQIVLVVILTVASVVILGILENHHFL